MIPTTAPRLDRSLSAREAAVARRREVGAERIMGNLQDELPARSALNSPTT
jgi:hypothetical protein